MEFLPKLNSLFSGLVQGMELGDIHPDLPAGIISQLEDGTFAIIDFKISNPKGENIQKYASQLHAYKYALENPLNGESPKNISGG